MPPGNDVESNPSISGIPQSGDVVMECRFFAAGPNLSATAKPVGSAQGTGAADGKLLSGILSDPAARNICSTFPTCSIDGIS
jgi:hypothetical protein